jgi:hypothetical protein
MAVRIIAIRKAGGHHDDPHEAISHYKWLNESNGNSDIMPRPDMVDWILTKNGRAYVSSQEGTVYCEVKKSPRGTLFLQTTTDSRSSNNLLNLPEC